LAGESVRAALEALAVAAPGWLTQTIDLPDSSARYTARVDSWRLPSERRLPARGEVGVLGGVRTVRRHR